MYRLASLLLSLCLFTLHGTTFQIVGVPTHDNSETPPRELPQRREINDLASRGAEFDLYILALRRFQEREQSNFLSYFQVAGIHGYPRQSWDGVNGSGLYPGFCTHAAVVFPTWHRAYLALFEQMIWTNAQSIAKSYPPEQRQEYQAAAKNVRIPYWDWAANPILPATTTAPTILVNTPRGPQEISNPLYEYRFHPRSEGNGFPVGHPLSGLNRTTRYLNIVTGQRNDSAASDVLLANAANTLAMTYQLLSSVSDYTSMSSTSAGGVANRVINLEGIHNNIHNFVGGFYGHMTWPELAAFDPIFWLHHANVDRLFALWQALNPNSYIVPTQNTLGSFAEIPGTIDSGSSGLAPFHADNGSTLYTSDGVRDVSTFGYTYPELTARNLSANDLTASVRRQVNALYAPLPSPSSETAVSRIKRSAAATYSRVSLEQAKQLALNNAAVQWSILIQVNPQSYETSYNLDFFMDQPPPPAQRSTAQNLIGTYAQFVIDKTCTPGSRMPAAESTVGEVSLTHVLLGAESRGLICDLTPASVIPVLQQQLKWAARTEDNQEINLGQFRDLSIVVRSRKVEPRTADCEFPSYGPWVEHPEATGNQPK